MFCFLRCCLAALSSMTTLILEVETTSCDSYIPPVSKVREGLDEASSLPLPASLPPVELLILLLPARNLAHARSL